MDPSDPSGHHGIHFNQHLRQISASTCHLNPQENHFRRGARLEPKDSKEAIEAEFECRSRNVSKAEELRPL